MADLTDAEIDTALERGRIAHLVEPRATAARSDMNVLKTSVLKHRKMITVRTLFSID